MIDTKRESESLTYSTIGNFWPIIAVLHFEILFSSFHLRAASNWPPLWTSWAKTAVPTWHMCVTHSSLLRYGRCSSLNKASLSFDKFCKELLKMQNVEWPVKLITWLLIWNQLSQNASNQSWKSAYVERKAIGQKYTRRAKIPIFASMTVVNFIVLPEPQK